MKVRETVRRRCEACGETPEIRNPNKRMGETPMVGFHTWHCRCEGVSRDSGCGHEESHLMHDT